MGKITTFVSGDQIGRILLLNWRATEIAKGLQLDLKVPTALVGDTGCGKTTVVKILYGMPTEESLQLAEEGKLVIGGCCITEKNPDWACTNCKVEYIKVK